MEEQDEKLMGQCDDWPFPHWGTTHCHRWRPYETLEEQREARQRYYDAAKYAAHIRELAQ